MKSISELKNQGFFELSDKDQIDFLRENGFFELSTKERIEYLENIGLFYIDINDDPPAPPLMPEDVDYLQKSIKCKFNRNMTMVVAKRFLNTLLKEKKLIIKQVNGLENLKDIDSGAILTCNHFNPFDCFAIEKVFRMCGQDKKRKLFKVIREGNYTNFPGLYGYFFKNCDTLPLSSVKSTMSNFLKAVDTILQKGDFILIYPEQSMWFNYKKPRPAKYSAFNFAAKNKVPVIPIFIALSDSNIIGEDGFPVQEYTVNIGNPIKPDKNLSVKENAYRMRDLDYDFCKSAYEECYGESLKYNTKMHEDLPKYIKSIECFNELINV